MFTGFDNYERFDLTLKYYIDPYMKTKEAYYNISEASIEHFTDEGKHLYMPQDSSIVGQCVWR